MKLKEYQEEALKRLNPTIANKDKESMRFACMGLLEEAGEVVAELRKPLYKGNFHEKALDKKAITSELGDVMWYVALTCRNNDINIEKLESKIDANKCSFDREKLIKKSIKLGRQSGIIAKRYIKYNKGKIEKEKLERSLKRQYKNILKISGMLDISIEDILKMNIEKANYRYDENGKANKIGEEDNER